MHLAETTSELTDIVGHSSPPMATIDVERLDERRCGNLSYVH